KAHKKHNPGLRIGVLGCMAERLKMRLLEEEHAVDLIAGPDAYRSLPELLSAAASGQKGANVLLSEEETYAEISPVKYNSNGVSAFISIMRGCENFCSYCVVPFTRGKERSRDPETIVEEAAALFRKGYREITLLGQNVNSYHWAQEDGPVRFPELIERVALVDSALRVRFATSHPRDVSDELLQAIARNHNLCKAIHLPVQSGSPAMLKLMNRKYDPEWYMNRIRAIREHIPDCTISTDIITGFCNETEEDHGATLSIMDRVGYDHAFMFKYSERPGTLAARHFNDNVPEKVKSQRLQEIIAKQRELSLKSNQKDVGKVFEVLVESFSRKSKAHLSGRNSQNKVIVFPKKGYKPGDYVEVKITGCTPATLLGEPLEAD
ncbi:MAG: tRNA (N6-isopentenyl adenosine(37)-C2)-methylthiotransferase MiaB, partial [Bacteroidales bacterium]